jgi:hypothetical protein
MVDFIQVIAQELSKLGKIGSANTSPLTEEELTRYFGPAVSPSYISIQVKMLIDDLGPPFRDQFPCSCRAFTIDRMESKIYSRRLVCEHQAGD